MKFPWYLHSRFYKNTDSHFFYGYSHFFELSFFYGNSHFFHNDTLNQKNECDHKKMRVLKKWELKKWEWLKKNESKDFKKKMRVTKKMRVWHTKHWGYDILGRLVEAVDVDIHGRCTVDVDCRWYRHWRERLWHSQGWRCFLVHWKRISACDHTKK